MEASGLRRLVEDLVAEKVQPLHLRIAYLESQVVQLQEAIRSSIKCTRYENRATLDVCATCDNKIARSDSTNQPENVPVFTRLSDETMTQILSNLSLRSAFRLQQCCQLQRTDLSSRGYLLWTCISEFLDLAPLHADMAVPAGSLYRWTGKTTSQVSASDDEDLSSLSNQRQVMHEVELDGAVALGICRRYLARTHFGSSGIKTLLQRLCIREDLNGAECRLCRRSSKAYRSEEAGGHVNTYEAEFVMPCTSGLGSDMFLRIDVTKYYNEGSCGWDEGLDVHCFVNGRELLNFHRDGSDPEYDTQSLNKGMLHQLATQLMVPASESMLVLVLVWQILCAPLLACGHWDEKKGRFGLGLPHRKDCLLMFRTLGRMFANAASPHSDAGSEIIQLCDSGEEDECVAKFVKLVLGE